MVVVESGWFSNVKTVPAPAPYLNARVHSNLTNCPKNYKYLDRKQEVLLCVDAEEACDMLWREGFLIKITDECQQ